MRISGSARDRGHRTWLGRSALVVGSVLWLLSAGGCISTAIVDQWRDPAFTGPPMHKVLVVGVQRDQGERRIWEDSMVAALERAGVQATPSYTVYPTKAPTADELAKTARADQFDGVFATHLLRAGVRYDWVPGFGPWGYGPWGFGPGWGFGWRWRYYGYWNSIYGPGYVVPQGLADYETDVFTVQPKGGMLIWTGITRSINLYSVQDTTDQISRVLVPQLLANGILAGKPSG